MDSQSIAPSSSHVLLVVSIDDAHNVNVYGHVTNFLKFKNRIDKLKVSKLIRQPFQIEGLRRHDPKRGKSLSNGTQVLDMKI